MKKLLIYGSKEFASVIKNLALTCNYECIGFVDDYTTGGEIIGNYEHVRDNFDPKSYEFVIAIGYKNLTARWGAYKKVSNDGYHVPAVIHPSAYISDISCVGHGSIIMAGVIVDFNAKIGELCVLWPGAIVNHDSRIGNNTFLSPNSTVCGCVEVLGQSFIGAGSVLVDHVTLPKGSFVKAGSVFTGR